MFNKWDTHPQDMYNSAKSNNPRVIKKCLNNEDKSNNINQCLNAQYLQKRSSLCLTNIHQQAKYFLLILSVTQTSQLMLYREIIAVCSQIHTKQINTVFGQNVELLNVKLAVYKGPVRTAQ